MLFRIFSTFCYVFILCLLANAIKMGHWASFYFSKYTSLKWIGANGEDNSFQL